MWVTGIVLAAGLSRRAGADNKLLSPFEGRPVVRATVEAVCAAGLDEVLVVTGHERAAVEAALRGLPVAFVRAEDFSAGMGRSLAAGVAAAAAQADGFAVVPGDLPWLRAATVREVVAAFREGRPPMHVVPVAAGRRGHPVVLGAWLREALCRLQGDAGARGLLAAPAERIRTRRVEVTDSGIWRDVDFGYGG
ncbi:MAG: nucleotidyltransferase family protein [Verrucomicrobia bacterium]|nr:MAG: nucleotidyltransferase family protein [Verrucomicrobiota bacterium]